MIWGLPYIFWLALYIPNLWIAARKDKWRFWDKFFFCLSIYAVPWLSWRILNG